MKRLLMLVGVAVVAAAMYVAASPASQQSSGPTAKQFNALKKQVATMSKELKTVKEEASTVYDFVGTCYVSNTGAAVALPVSQFGTDVSGPGFLFGDSGTSAPRTALDIDTSASPQYYLAAVNSECKPVSPALGQAAVHSAGSRLGGWAGRGR